MLEGDASTGDPRRGEWSLEDGPWGLGLLRVGLKLPSDVRGVPRGSPPASRQDGVLNMN